MAPRKKPTPPPGDRTPKLGLSFLFSAGWPYLLTPFIPIAIVLDVLGASSSAIFISSALGVVPTAALMGRATEELAARSGPGIGGLLNVTFGNAPELIIALFALNKGLHEVVKASIIGSILGNILLVLGASMFVGGLGRKRQRFRRESANAQSSMLFLAAAALSMPAIFELVNGHGLPSPKAELIDFGSRIETLSIVVAGILIFSYIAGLVFSLRTHSDVFNPPYEDEETWGWSARKSAGMLALAGLAVGGMSEILVGSIEEASHSIGLSEFFVGAIVVAIVGNAAEHWVAVLVARKDKMDLSVNIAIGSAAQIALFVAPVLVLASLFIGPVTMPLVFNGFELAALLLAVVLANVVTNEGESNWFEGLQLLLVWVVLAVSFAFA
ncbi:MAG: calcium/proton exchanger [Solirubrobacterales bacterium]